jgi:hypothetical protein
MNIGIICNGRHVQTRNWETVVWGQSGQMGQIPAAIRALRQFSKMGRVVALAFGTGASERNGIPEGRVMVDFMFANLHRLATEFPYFSKMTGEELEHLRAWLSHVAVAETASRNTTEEFLETMKIFRDREADLVVDVTSKTHAPRCMLDLSKIWETLDYRPREGFLVVPAETGYGDVPPGGQGVVIFEYPHRGDTPPEYAELYELAAEINQRFFGENGPGHRSFLDGLRRLLETETAGASQY